MAQNKFTPTEFRSVGGSDTHLILTFKYFDDKSSSFQYMPVYMGSVITLSYSVFRNKKQVFNLGQHTIDGFAVGTKYVAGSIIKAMLLDDDLQRAVNSLKNRLKTTEAFTAKLETAITPREFRNLIADDLLSFDIDIVYSNEYDGKIVHDTIYDATFVNTGQVASIADLISETTLSYIARDVRTHNDIRGQFGSMKNGSPILTATQLIGKFQ